MSTQSKPVQLPKSTPSKQAGLMDNKFFRDFLMGGVSAGISKTIASPIEVVKMRI